MALPKLNSEHSATFASLSVLNIPKSGWTCQVIDGVKNQNKWDTIDSYQGTDPATAVVSGFNGPYTINFSVTDGGATLDLIATVKLDGTASLTDGSGTALAAPSNGKPQIDPGIDLSGAQVWFRWESGSSLRELRFHTALNAAAVARELETLGLGWLGKLIPGIENLLGE